jgi:acyl carrier protein
MDEILRILEDIKPGVKFEGNTSLVSDGLLDSFDIISLVGELNDSFGIEIPVEDIIPENFESVEKIAGLVEMADEKNS